MRDGAVRQEEGSELQIRRVTMPPTSFNLSPTEKNTVVEKINIKKKEETRVYLSKWGGSAHIYAGLYPSGSKGIK